MSIAWRVAATRTHYGASTMEVKNTTNRPIKLSLPAGKKLFLGIGGTGQIMPKAAEHPPVKKLIDAGDLEITDIGRGSKASKSGGGGGIKSPQSQGGPSSSIRKSGDR